MNQHEQSRIADLESVVAQATDEFMELASRDGAPPVEEFVRRYPEAASVLRQVLPALEVLRSPAGKHDPSVIRPLIGGVSGRIGDFEIVREVARGGMGVVYEARQLSLDRQVALKVLPFTAALDPKQIQRFKNEAQAAAHLQHQHIVPIYSVGDEQGIHYYAMQFVDGHTLATLIDELRIIQSEAPAAAAQVSELASGLASGRPLFSTAQAAANDEATQSASPEHAPVDDTCSGTPENPSSPSATAATSKGPSHARRFFRTAANLGVQAAEALEHAHQFGVVHRDVKPGNLMVDHRGNLWITDFGLAQLQSDSSLTMTGDLLGTMRYMSPEQARGERSSLDHRTDVYSLGVTLYELLTLRPAFTATDRQRLFAQVLGDEPTPLRQVNRGIPVELETIVLKSMAKNRGERYATAQELADDLRRFLDHKPILARRPTLMERASKWSRRHRAVVTTGLVSLVTLLVFAVVMLSLSTAVVTAERNEKQEALEEKNAALERAEENLQTAWQTVNDYFSDVADDPELSKPTLQQLRGNLLRQALTYYERFLQQQSDNPKLQVEIAATLLRIGYVYHIFGENDQAIDADRRAADVLEAILEERPEQLAHYTRMAGYWKGSQRQQSVNPVPIDVAAAVKTLQRLISLFETILDIYPHADLVRSDLAATNRLMGDLLAAMKRREEARTCFESALALWTDLSDRDSEQSRYRAEMAATLEALSSNLLALGHRDEGESARERATQLIEDLVQRSPDSATYLSGLAQLLDTRARRASRSADAAEEDFRRAIEIGQKLHADYPNVQIYREELASAHYHRAQKYLSWNRKSEAMLDFRLAAELFSSLKDKELGTWLGRDYLNARIELAGLLYEFGIEQQLAEQVKVAEQQFRDAIGLYAQLVEAAPASMTHRVNLFQAIKRFAELMHAAGNTEAVRALIAPHAARLDELRSQVRDPRELRALFHAMETCVEVLSLVGEDERALRRARQLVGTMEQAVTVAPTETIYRQELGKAHWIVGAMLRKVGKRNEAEAHYRQALGIYEQLVDEVPDHAFFHQEVGFSLWNLGDLLGELGRPDEAEEAYRRAASIYAASAQRFPNEAILRERTGQSYERLAALLQQRGKIDAAQKAREQAIEWREADPQTYVDRAAEHTSHGQWADAMADLAKAIALGHPGAREYGHLALLTCYVEGPEAYRAHCAKMIEQFRGTAGHLRAENVAHACTIAPDAVSDFTPVIALARHATAVRPDKHLYARTLAAVLMRAGEYEEALEELNRARSLFGRDTPVALPLRALIEYELGHSDEARLSLHKAATWVQRLNPSAAPPGGSPLPWTEQLMVELLYKEANSKVVVGKQ